MGRPKELSTFTIVQILPEQGLSEREISKKVNGIHVLLQKKKLTASIEKIKRDGRPRTTSECTDLSIVATSKRNRQKTTPEITAEINVGREKKKHVSTVKRRLAEVGLNDGIAVRKPLLRTIN